METFGQRIKDKRKARNITVLDFASAVGVSVDMVMKVESGKRGCVIEKLPKIARALGCRIDDLFPEMDDVSETPALAPTKEPEQEEEDIWAGMDLS